MYVDKLCVEIKHIFIYTNKTYFYLHK